MARPTLETVCCRPNVIPRAREFGADDLTIIILALKVKLVGALQQDDQGRTERPFLPVVLSHIQQSMHKD